MTLIARLHEMRRQLDAAIAEVEGRSPVPASAPAPMPAPSSGSSATFWFGKFANVPLADVDSGYLTWFSDDVKSKGGARVPRMVALLAAVDLELAHRQGDARAENDRVKQKADRGEELTAGPDGDIPF